MEDTTMMDMEAEAVIDLTINKAIKAVRVVMIIPNNMVNITHSTDMTKVNMEDKMHQVNFSLKHGRSLSEANDNIT